MEKDIAVVGIGCRFPGADNIEEFWRVLLNGENHVVDIPSERWNTDAFYSDDRDEPEKIYVRKAALLKRFDEWDNEFFGVSGKEAEQMDPQQRFVLECTHMAMEDGGITRKELDGSLTGVYIGAMGSDYRSMFEADHSEDTNYIVTGTSTTIIASRVSYVYNLQGPCMIVDSACSASMIAIHLGCQAIRTGDCEMAVCGGVSNLLSPDPFQGTCRAKMLSPTCQCQSFCETADGYVRGEGCGIIFLKLYEKAVQDGNKIWGIIKTGTNQDGHMAQPITAPAGNQQEKLLRKIYDQYGVNPTALHYIECHGTGTPVGDPIEVNAIGEFISSYQASSQSHEMSVEEIEKSHNTDSSLMQKDSNSKHTILIGSVKTNIGHLEPAAGVAGLIKVLLMMEHGKFVPSLHVKKDKSNLNKKIKFNQYCLDVSVKIEAWYPNTDGDRIACVNSFGFGGSNAHAIVIQKSNDTNEMHSISKDTSENGYKAICLSALNNISLKDIMERLGKDIASGMYALQDISFTSLYHRDHFSCRTLVFGKDIDEVKQKLQQKCHSMATKEKRETRLILVFCGVGTNWKGMCKEMMETLPIFKRTVTKIDEILQSLPGCYTIGDKFVKATDYSDAFLSHIALFSTQIALFEVWKGWGVLPDAVIGQSVGEVAAAYASGALSLKDAVSVIYVRSKCLSKITSGKMMVVGNYSKEKLEEICMQYDNRVNIAVLNSHKSCTLSGDDDIIDRIKTDLETVNKSENADILLTPLRVPCAYHSHHVEKCTSEVLSQLNCLERGRSRIDLFSTVTGEHIDGNELVSAKYWIENIRKPVQLANAVKNSAGEDVLNVFLELGPRQILRTHLSDILGDKYDAICLPSMNKGKEGDCIYSSLCTLYELGDSVKIENVVSKTGTILPVPRYVFRRVKRLLIPQKHKAMLKGNNTFIDSHVFVKLSGDERKFCLTLDHKTVPYVFEHFFTGTRIVPGAIYIEAAIEAGKKSLHLSAYQLSVSTEFIRPLKLVRGTSLKIDVNVKEELATQCHKYEVVHDGKPLCRGKIVRRTKQQIEKLDIIRIKRRCKTYKSKNDCYEYLEKMYFTYGDSLRIVKQTWSSSSECLAEFELPDLVISQGKQTNIHPCVIDGLFQIVVILHQDELDCLRENPIPFFPKDLESIVLNKPIERKMFAYAHLKQNLSTGNVYSFCLVSSDGHVIAEVHNFTCKMMSETNTMKSTLSYDLKWLQMEPEQNNRKDGRLCIIGSKRFNDFFKKFCVESSYHVWLELERSEALEEMVSNISTVEAVLFAPCFEVEDIVKDCEMLYNASKVSFLSLAHVIKLLEKNSCTVPLYVITENAVATQKQSVLACIISGAVLWGMVRSAVCEQNYNDIRLIDMILCVDSARRLLEILKGNFAICSEYIIRESHVYCSNLVEVPFDDSCTRKRDVTCYFNDNVLLKTASPVSLLNPWLELVPEGKSSQLHNFQQEISVQSICLHKNALYPISVTFCDAENYIWPENSHVGFHVTCLEGVGLIHQREEKSSKIVFCYPVETASRVFVPEDCTYSIEKIPAYVPGVVTASVIFWNLIKTCDIRNSVTVIVNSQTDKCIQFFKHMFSRLGETHDVSTETLDSSEINCSKHTNTVIILTNVTYKNIEKLVSLYPNATKIVGIDLYLPRYSKLMIERLSDSLSVHILKTEDMFQLSTLPKVLPALFAMLESLDGDMTDQNTASTEDPEQELQMFHLPSPVFEFPTKGSVSKIPLRVNDSELFSKYGCYIIVGGLTGLGWELLQYIAELGAGYIATISRRSLSDEKKHEIKFVEDRYGCKIFQLQANICDKKSLQKVLESLQLQIQDIPIKGIFQGAGALSDKLLKDMSEVDLETALRPKVLGTLNLHILTKEMPLDFFVMQSSIVSVLGNRGQCNYGAGNAFLDSFAHYRRSLGLSGQSINWSALSVGMSIENERLQAYLENKGIELLNGAEIRLCFMKAVKENQTQMIFGKIDWKRLLQDVSNTELNAHKFNDIREKYSGDSIEGAKDVQKLNIDDTFFRLNKQEQKRSLITLIKSKMAETFVVESNSLSDESTFASLGVDSMVAMSFTNSMYEATGVKIPIANLFPSSASIESISNFILSRFGETSKRPLTDHSKSSDETEFEFLQGSINFMQRSILSDYEKDPHSADLVRQASWEMVRFDIPSTLWRKVLRNIIMKNPDLRRVYRKQKNGTYESVLLRMDQIEITVEETDYDAIHCKHWTDERSRTFIDLSKDIPIRLVIARKDKNTRVVLYLHAIVADLHAFSVLIQDIQSSLISISQKTKLPDDVYVDSAEAVRITMAPKMSKLKQYWQHVISQSDIRPFTFGEDISAALARENWREISDDLSSDLVNLMVDFVHSQEMTLYNFITSVYMFLLFEETGHTVIPLITNVDMRVHIPELQSVVTRCVNEVPVIGDLRELMTVKKYLEKCSSRFLETTENGAYPYELIEKTFQSEQLKMHIGRHRLIMNNMTDLNRAIKDTGLVVNDLKLFYKRHIYETSLTVLHDKKEKSEHIKFQFGYNSSCLNEERAKHIFARLLTLFKTFIENPESSLNDFLQLDEKLTCK